MMAHQRACHQRGELLVLDIFLEVSHNTISGNADEERHRSFLRGALLKIPSLLLLNF